MEKRVEKEIVGKMNDRIAQGEREIKNLREKVVNPKVQEFEERIGHLESGLTLLDHTFKNEVVYLDSYNQDLY